MLAWAMIAIQVAAAAAALHLLRWHVLPSLARLPHRELIVDVWGPVAIVLPVLFTVAWTGHSVRGDGWVAIGGPVACGMIGLAFAAILGRGAMAWDSPLSGIMALIAGVVLLLLGAAHVMHILVGQVTFALVAVVLWINTPDSRQSDVEDETESRVWLSMIVVVLLTAVMGASAIYVTDHFRILSASIMLGFAACTLAMAAIYAGAALAMRMALWTAAIGCLGGLGAISISYMLPHAFRLFQGGEPADVQWVAFGFGAYALEGAILLVLPVVVFLLGMLPPASRWAAGAGLLVAALALAIWRLSQM